MQTKLDTAASRLCKKFWIKPSALLIICDSSMTALPAFGDAVPLGDPAWYQGLNTPFYKPTHAEWRKYVRDYCEEVLEPVLGDWEQCAVKGNLEKCHEYMHQTYSEGGKRGILACAVGKPWPKDYTDCKAPADYDNFHELIVIDAPWAAFGCRVWVSGRPKSGDWDSHPAGSLSIKHESSPKLLERRGYAIT